MLGLVHQLLGSSQAFRAVELRSRVGGCKFPSAIRRYFQFSLLAKRRSRGSCHVAVKAGGDGGGGGGGALEFHQMVSSRRGCLKGLGLEGLGLRV